MLAARSWQQIQDTSPQTATQPASFSKGRNSEGQESKDSHTFPRHFPFLPDIQRPPLSFTVVFRTLQELVPGKKESEKHYTTGSEAIHRSSYTRQSLRTRICPNGSVSSFDTAAMCDRHSQSRKRWFVWLGFCQGLPKAWNNPHSPHPPTHKEGSGQQPLSSASPIGDSTCPKIFQVVTSLFPLSFFPTILPAADPSGPKQKVFCRQGKLTLMEPSSPLLFVFSTPPSL